MQRMEKAGLVVCDIKPVCYLCFQTEGRAGSNPSCSCLQQLASDLSLTALPAAAGTETLSPQAVPFAWPFPQPRIWEAKV